MRTPTQILTCILTTISAFLLPLGLASILPDVPSEPRIESRFVALEVQLKPGTPSPTPGSESADPARHPSGKPPSSSPAVGASAEDPNSAPGTENSHLALASMRPRVPTNPPLRPDRSLNAATRGKLRKRRHRKPCAEPVAGITETGRNRYSIERELVNYYTSHLRQSEQLAATSWHRKNGQIDGFRVKKVRCGTPLHQLGFRNGDVVTSVGGHPVTSATQALRALRALRRNDTLRIRVTSWKGETKTLNYRLS